MEKNYLGICSCVSALALLCLTFGIAPALAQDPLDPATIPKYVEPLAKPPVMPMTSELPGGIAYYEVAARQLSQQILPTTGFGPGGTDPFPQTTVWGYGSVSDPSSFSAPGPTFEVTADTPVRVKWINGLVDQDGNFIPHLLAENVDQTLHWANPPQQCADGTTSTDCVGLSEDPYLGPVPIVTHLHGSHVAPESDGHPEAWYLPAANDIPAGYAIKGTHFGQIAGAPVEPGAAYFQYSNDQRATTLWYHDHSLGITSVNTYTGLAGFYLIRGGATDLAAGVLPGGAYEIPIAIQERAFLDDGSLNYTSPNGAGDGDTMMVNGKTWPYLEVEPRRYRFRFLNGSNNNPIHLELATDSSPGDNSIDDGGINLLTDPFTQIGADGGFLPAPVAIQKLLLHPAERVDVIVDFSTFEAGDILYLVNSGDNPANLGQVMKIAVVALTSPDSSTPVGDLVLPAFTPLGSADKTRQVSLNMGAPGQPPDLLGIVDPDSGLGVPLLWMDAVTESPRLDSTEIWEIHNFSAMEHPIHLHQVQFEIIDRRALGTSVGDPSTTPPEPGETGTKDTVIVGDNQIARVKAKFDIPGLFVWHCHILIHEDDEMMRPFYVAGLTVSDALRALQIAVGMVTPTADDLRYLDLAPLVNGVSTPDGKIDITDALLILRRAIGLTDV
jgi:bilirubin oxidase